MKKVLLTLAIALASHFVNAAPFADTSTVTVQVGAGSKSSSINVLDKVTGNVISATITNVVIQNNNPELATVTIPYPGTPNIIRVAPVSAGSGTAVISCHIDYTDPGDGLQKSEDKTIVINYTVIAAPHGVKLSLTFN